MPAKKKSPKKTARSRPRAKTAKMPPDCSQFGTSLAKPPPTPLGFYEMQLKLQEGGAFAKDFNHTLQLAVFGGTGSRRARECIKAWYKLTAEDLFKFCIPQRQHARLSRCTDQNLLLSVIAYQAPKLDWSEGA